MTPTETQPQQPDASFTHSRTYETYTRTDIAKISLLDELMRSSTVDETNSRVAGEQRWTPTYNEDEKEIFRTKLIALVKQL